MRTGIYRHYKGNFYLVLGVAQHSETNEDLVVYVPLYLHPSGGKALRARPRGMFEESVEFDGTLQPRFAFVGEERPVAK
jgi:hypothetical protein